MTLNELGIRVSKWFADSLDTITGQNILDWPLSLVALVAFVALVMVSIAWATLEGFFEAIGEMNRRSHERKEKLRSATSGVPTDPRERLEWANRTGRYAPGAEKGE